jgi:hypothetical protein
VSNAKHLEGKLLPLVGAELVGVQTDKDDFDDEWLCLVLKKDGKVTALWVSRDPEGNGPGWLDIAEQE